MKKPQWYFKQLVTQGEMNDFTTWIEEAMQNMFGADADVWGVASGLVVAEDAPPSFKVTVIAGVAYDEDGQRIVLSGASDIDLTTSVPGANSRYVDIYIEQARVQSDARIDGAGVPLNYVHDDGYAFHIEEGAIAAGPSRPAIVPNKVLLATVLLTNGMGSITNSEIGMDYFGLSAATVERQVGTPVAPGRLLGDNMRLAWSSAIGDTVIKLGATNILDFATAYLIGSTVIASQSVGSYGINPAATQGFLYRQQASPYTLLEIEKWLNYDATALMVGENNNQHPWQSYAIISNVWQLNSVAAGAIGGGAVPSWDTWAQAWRCEINMPAGPYPKFSWPLFCPLTGLPHGSKLTRVEFDLEVLGTMTGFMNLKHCVMSIMRRRGDDVDILSADPPSQFQQAAAGRYTHGEDVAGGGYVIDNDNEEYYAAFYLATSDAGVFNNLRVCGARAKYIHREASGVY